ncbi:hypothetical protein FA15DRAFT_157652 [Coprinopsis marcescibilis]|uniref:Uncharacterized protein n=1 Tax=Coprinopsis marcescibilis TaxID=230819 RepID=A0A5C3KV74_COPMA|nr:hypothetical protein FA15DRAFT_157652 [Coprinopsis marcescibilis]
MSFKSDFHPDSVGGNKDLGENQADRFSIFSEMTTMTTPPATPPPRFHPSFFGSQQTASSGPWTPPNARLDGKSQFPPTVISGQSPFVSQYIANREALAREREELDHQKGYWQQERERAEDERKARERIEWENLARVKQEMERDRERLERDRFQWERERAAEENQQLERNRAVQERARKELDQGHEMLRRQRLEWETEKNKVLVGKKSHQQFEHERLEQEKSALESGWEKLKSERSAWELERSEKDREADRERERARKRKETEDWNRAEEDRLKRERDDAEVQRRLDEIRQEAEKLTVKAKEVDQRRLEAEQRHTDAALLQEKLAVVENAMRGKEEELRQREARINKAEGSLKKQDELWKLLESLDASELEANRLADSFRQQKQIVQQLEWERGQFEAEKPAVGPNLITATTSEESVEGKETHTSGKPPIKLTTEPKNEPFTEPKAGSIDEPKTKLGGKRKVTIEVVEDEEEAILRGRRDIQRQPDPEFDPKAKGGVDFGRPVTGNQPTRPDDIRKNPTASNRNHHPRQAQQEAFRQREEEIRRQRQEKEKAASSSLPVPQPNPIRVTRSTGSGAQAPYSETQRFQYPAPPPRSFSASPAPYVRGTSQSSHYARTRPQARDSLPTPLFDENRARPETPPQPRVRSKGEAVATFKRNERMWKELSTMNSLRWVDFPWPVFGRPSTPDEIYPLVIKEYVSSPYHPHGGRPFREHVLEYIRRWNHDRFGSKFLNKVVEDDRERVQEAADTVMKGLVGLLPKV